MTSLINLYLRNNELIGTIQTEINNLINLASLFLSINQLSGEILASICELNIDFEFFTNLVPVRFNKLCPPYPSSF